MICGRLSVPPEGIAAPYGHDCSRSERQPNVAQGPPSWLEAQYT